MPEPRFCRKCGIPLAWSGRGRPREWCDACRPLSNTYTSRQRRQGRRLIEPRECPWCRETFAPSRSNQKFCKPAHGQYFSVAGGRARLHAGGMGARIPLPDRIWPKVNKDGPGGCWLWTGSLSDNKYGILDLQVDGRKRRFQAHRLVYELLVGPIPEGLTLDHVWDRGCRFRHCVNPDHLEPVTQKENTRRAGVVLGNGRRHGACFLVGTRTYVERWQR